MIEYRKARPEERKAYIDFADMVFTDVGFETAIPKVYGPDVDSARMQDIAYDPERGIVGLVATLPNDLTVGEQVLKTGYIGTVSVHPEARGEGHMKKLMSMSIEEMQENGTDIALLNGQRQRYEHFGFVAGGTAWAFRVSWRNVKHALKDVCADGIEFVCVEPGSELEAQAAQLHEKQPIRFARPRFAVHCMTYVNNHLVAAVRDGRLIGYLVCNENKGSLAELDAVSVEALDAVIKAWIQQNELPHMNFLLPDWKVDFVRHLNAYAEFVQRQPNVSVRVLHRAKVIAALLSAKSSFAKLQDAVVSYEIEGERFSVAVKDGKVSVGECAGEPVVLSGLEADKLFFYPHDYEGRPEAPCGWFPLPLFAAAPDEF